MSSVYTRNFGAEGPGPVASCLSVLGLRSMCRSFDEAPTKEHHVSLNLPASKDFGVQNSGLGSL